MLFSSTAWHATANQLWQRQHTPKKKVAMENISGYIYVTRLEPTIEVFLTRRAMMTSSNGNIFRVTGPLCGEFTGPGEFPTQRPVTRSFDVFLDLRLNKRLSKQPWGWWFETPSWSLLRQCNGAGEGDKNALIDYTHTAGVRRYFDPHPALYINPGFIYRYIVRYLEALWSVYRNDILPPIRYPDSPPNRTLRSC